MREVFKNGFRFLINPLGFAKAESEKMLYRFLTESYFNRDPTIIREFEFPGSRRFIDYRLGTDKNPVFYEVKNWFISIKDMGQIIEYLCHIKENYDNYEFKVISGGVSRERKEILNALKIENILIRNLIE